MRRLRPSLQIYGALLGALADGERWAEVLTYLDRMVADGLVPDAVATNTAVLAAAELGDGRRALSLLEGKGSGRSGGGSEGSAGSGSEDELQQRQRELGVVTDGGCGDALPRNQRPGRGEAVLRVDRNAEEEAVLRGAGSVPVERREPNEQGEVGGGRPARAVVERQAMSGRAAAAVKASATEETPLDVAGETEERGVRQTYGAGSGTTGGEENSGLADGVVTGGWGTATPGLLSSVLHALDEAGEDAAVLEAVKRGREKGVLLTPSIYR